MSPDLQTRLTKLNTDQLINVVKNYRQYGYSLEVRSYSLDLLEKRGISQADLQLTNSLDNQNYIRAKEIFTAYITDSCRAFICYGVALMINVLMFFISHNTTEQTTVILTAGKIIFIVLYLLFLFRSFLSQDRFLQVVGDSNKVGSGLIYLFLGMPFYVVLYFVFKQQMVERMKMID